ncbi:MAG TPA: hypothetical protein VK454_11710 [Myxococcaceae bacterium]|nr:hypothetical protein [Myxococcaceae bacterium]
MVHAGFPTLLSELVRARGVVPESTLVDAVAGEPVHGSWWSHPASHAIFRALEDLREDRDVFLCKLLGGKQTYVHRRLWPALVRVQAEEPLWPKLSPEARRLLARVEREGPVQATGQLRLELERSLRVVSRSEHTPSGAHASMLSPFVGHFPPEVAAEARSLPLDRALAALADAGVQLSAPRRKAPVRAPSGRRGRGTGRRARRPGGRG